VEAACNLQPVAFEEKACSVPQTVVVARPRSYVLTDKQRPIAKWNELGSLYKRPGTPNILTINVERATDRL
jgi:hypothetical protein